VQLRLSSIARRLATRKRKAICRLVDKGEEGARRAR
jgi:hypothetical protein